MNKLTTILLDLDGTLLPMDQNMFIKLYFKELVTHFIPYGFSQETMIEGVNEGTKAMSINDGSVTNEERFWSVFAKHLGPEIRNIEPEFEKFYLNEFNKVKASTTTNPITALLIQTLKDKGLEIVIATNPLFPKVATHARIKWAGFSPEDAAYITTYETCTFCKPNLNYYREILQKVGKDPSECMMVGNDVSEDMIVDGLGMKRYLITDCLINHNNDDISKIPNGSLKDFLKFVESL